MGSANKGLRVLLGTVAMVIWARYWWYGSLYEALIPHHAETKSLENATGPLLELAVDLLWGLGSVIIGVLSMGKWLASDVASGVVDFVRKRWPSPSASPSPTFDAPADQPRAIDDAKLVAVLQSHEDRLSTLEKPARPPYRRASRQEKTPKGK